MKAKKDYKCTCCDSIFCMKGEDMEDVEMRVGEYNKKNKVIPMFCSTECAANWYTSEDTLDNVIR